MTARTRRILITPNVAAPYDQRMVKGLAEGFNALGHFAGAVDTPVDAHELLQLCQSLSIDVVLQVNRTRDPAVPLPDGVRHVAWFQDVYPETQDGFAETFKDSDILYTLGNPKVLGLHAPVPCRVDSLFTGVTDAMLRFPRSAVVQDLDMSLCGGLPPPVQITPNGGADLLWALDKLVERLPFIGRSQAFWLLRKALFSKRLPVDYVPYASLKAIAMIVEGFYRPLRGELDIHELAEAMKAQVELIGAGPARPPARARKDGSLARILKPYAAASRGRRDWRARLTRYLANETAFQADADLTAEQRAISYFSQSYPRIMDRQLLVELALQVSPSLELWGPGLSAHAFAAPHLKGIITNQDDLLRVYCRSKLNLNNNTHGLGLHSRTLECMAVGGFVFMHHSPHDDKAGGMQTEFEPGVHYGMYTPENFHDEAQRWLRDDSARRAVGERAAEVIRERHRWIHRAQQVLDDLEC